MPLPSPCASHSVRVTRHSAAAHLTLVWQHQHPGMHKFGGNDIRLLLRPGSWLWLLPILLLLLLGCRLYARLCVTVRCSLVRRPKSGRGLRYQ
jgi:hypothetical protein